MDSMRLYDTISTLNEGNEYRLRQTAQQIWDSFEGNEIDILRWIAGKNNIVDAPTKNNLTIWKLVDYIAITGQSTLQLNTGHAFDSAE